MTDKATTTSNAAGGPPSPMELVREFHRTYSVPIRSFDDPTLSYDRVGMRMSLIAEEFAELMGAVYGKRARPRFSCSCSRRALATEERYDEYLAGNG